MTKKILPLFPYFLAFCSGAILPLAFAPSRIDILAFISLTIFFILVDKTQTKWRKALVGLFFGFGLYTTGLSWVSISIQLYTNSWAIGVTTAALLVVVASLVTTFAFALIINFLIKKDSPILKIFVYPVVWLLVEMFKANVIFGGFPWVSIGYSQTENPLIGYATICGVYFVTYIVAFISAIFTFAIIPNRNSIKKIAPFALIICVIYTLGSVINNHDWYKITSDKQKIILVQGDFVKGFKWDINNFRKMKEYYKTTAEKYKDAMLFYPENAIPAYKEYEQSYFKQLDNIAKKNNNSILIGSLSEDNDGSYYNAATVVGNGDGSYRKHHLVPFGEYFPVISSLNYEQFDFSNFSAGDAIQPLTQMSGNNVANFICYEISYPEQVRNQLQDAGFIAVISDDAWFGDSVARYQHLQIEQVRAIENGKYLLHDTNNGITAVIDPHGKIYAILSVDVQAILESYIYATKSYTIWNSIGMSLVWLISILTMTIALIIRFKK